MAKNSHTSRKKIPDLKPRMLLFLLGFVVCTVIGSFLRGPVEAPLYESHRNFFWFLRDVRTFFYEGVGQFLGRAVGLPIAGEAGRVFTLLSSLFFFLMSASLYCAPSGTELADFGEAPENGTARAVHFIVSYPYLASLSYIMMDSRFGGMGRSNRFYHTVILLLFLIVPLASIYDHSSDERPVRQKYPARWLASIGVALSCAGFGWLLADSTLVSVLHAPTAAWKLIGSLAETIPATVGGILHTLLLLAVPAAILTVCAFVLLKEKNCNIPFSIVSFTLPVGGGMIFYAFRGTNGTEPRSAATWILLLFAAVVWAAAAPRRKLPVFAASLLLFYSGSALAVGIRLLRDPFFAAIDAARTELLPLQELAMDRLLALVPHMFVACILALVVLAAVSLLLGLPLSLSKKIPKLFVFPLSRVKLLYLASVIILFSELDHPVIRTIGFVLLLLAILCLAALLGTALAVRKGRAIFSVLYTVACMALLTVPFALFAVPFAWIIFAVLIMLNFLGMAEAARSAGVTSDDSAKQQHAAASGLIHSAAMDGGGGYSLHELSLLQSSVNFTFGTDRSIWDGF